MSEQILSKDEVDALLQGISENEAPPAAPPQAAGGVRAYDLAREDRMVRGRMPTLEIVNERFARNIRSALFTLIRRAAEVSIGGVQVHKYSAFLAEVAAPTNFNIVNVKPLRGTGLVVCDPAVIFAAIEALFGGAGKFPSRLEGREFSATEQRVIMRLVEIVTAEYRKAWEGIYPLELQYQRSEMLPQLANVATPTEVVVSTRFTLEIGESSGAIHVCIPYSTLEPIRETLYSPMVDVVGHDRRWVSLIRNQIKDASVEVVVELAQAPATVEQLLAFKPGDFIELDLPQQVRATINGVPVLAGHYGTTNGRYAVKVDQILTGPSVGWLGDKHVR